MKRFSFFLACIAIIVSTFVPVAAQAQDPPAAENSSTERVTEAMLRDLVKTIEDDAKREQMLHRLEGMMSLFVVLRDETERDEMVGHLRALIASMEDGVESTEEATDESRTPIEELGAFFSRLSEGVEEAAVEFVDQAVTIPDRVRALGTTLREPESRRRFLVDAGMVVGIGVVAVMAAILAASLLRRPREALGVSHAERPSRLERIGRALLRLLLDLVAPGIAAAIAFGALAALPASPVASAIAVSLVAAYAIDRALVAIVRCVLAPQTPSIRLVRVGDATAARLTRSLHHLVSVAVFGYFAIQIIAAAGAELELLDPLRNLYGVVLLVCGISFVLRYRKLRTDETADPKAAAAGAAPSTDDETTDPIPESTWTGFASWVRFVRPFLRLWWIVAILYMLGLYTIWIGRVEGAFVLALRASGLSLLAFAVALLFINLVDHVLDRLAERAEGWTERLPALRERVPTYVRSLEAIAVAAILVFALSVALEAWGLRALEALTSSLVRTVLAVAIQLFLTVLVAMAVVDIATALTQSYLARREKSGNASAKVRTLVPLANKTIKVVVSIVAGIMILSEVGVEIGPLLAGVGVLGLAIGFGAQTLVKDIITGVFILIEDSVSVGDVVNVGGTSGLVEAINIRTIRLRDLHGHVHLVPYSTVDKVSNMTKEFSRYVADIGVAYRENVDEVIELIRRTGDELRADPEEGKDILEPIEIFGLDRFEDSAVVIRARLTTRPLKQWATGRAFLKRIKIAFDEAGVEIPFPHRTIYMGEDKDGTAPPLTVRDLESLGAGRDARDGGGDKPDAPTDAAKSKASGKPTTEGKPTTGGGGATVDPAPRQDTPSDDSPARG